jgi:hypothetical protein
MTIKAALLDERGIFLRMDEVADETQLTDRHVRSITSCDLPSGEYMWVTHTRNAFGGEFVSVAWLDSTEKTLRKASADASSKAKGSL